MAIEIAFTIMSSILMLSIVITFFSFFVSYFRRKFQTEQYIQPLDRVDAEKLTAIVDEQIVLYILPLMQSKGYTEEKIKEILTAKPVGQKPIFRR